MQNFDPCASAPVIFVTLSIHYVYMNYWPWASFCSFPNIDVSCCKNIWPEKYVIEIKRRTLNVKPLMKAKRDCSDPCKCLPLGVEFLNQSKWADILYDCIWFHGLWLWVHISPFSTSKHSNHFISRSSFTQLLITTSSAPLISGSAFSALMNLLLQQRIYLHFSQHLVSFLQLSF